MLDVSIIYVTRFQGRYNGQPAPLNRPHRWTTTIHLHTCIHSITVPWNNDGILVLQSTRQSVPLLDVLLLLHSRNSCICPEPLPTKNIPRQPRPVQQNTNNTCILQQQNSNIKTTNVPIVELFVLHKLLRTCCVGIFALHISPCGRPTTLLYIADNREFLSAPSKDTTLQVYRYSFYHSCSILEYLQYFQVLRSQCQ